MLRLSKKLLQAIEEDAETSHPEECCGVLFGTKDGERTTVSKVLKLDNKVDKNRTHRFLITPGEYRLAEMKAAKLGVEIVGLYHSHPDHPERPSQFDLDHAFPWWSYVIVSVSKTKIEAVKSWVMKEDRSAFEEEMIMRLNSEK